jgi:hypothetical protein
MIQGKTITVEAIEDHTYDGIPRPKGTRYDVEEGHLDFLTLRGFARPVADTPPPPPSPTPAPEPPAKPKKR